MPLNQSADPISAQGRGPLQAADERTALLGPPAHDAVAPNVDGDSASDLPKANGHVSIPRSANDEAPDACKGHMPYTQVILLCWCAIAEPTAYFGIFPFINEMISRTGGIDERDVGFYSGLIESLFSLVQMVLMIFYGRMADRLGRKPVLVFSLFGVGVATAFFGMSQALWVMIVFRCTAGAFAGSVVTVRTMIGEITNKESQGRAFSWYMFSRNMGILLGPIIGGGLANPATVFPNVFGGVEFFENYPYALATFVTALVVFSSAIIALFFINETLQRKTEGQIDAEPPMTTWQVLKSPGVLMVLYIYGHISLLALCYTAISPVFMYTGVSFGGFGFSDQQIAVALMIIGASQAFWTLLLFPWLQRKFGTGGVLRGCSAAWPVFMAGFPMLNEFLRNGWTKAFWPVLVPGLFFGSAVSMAFAAEQLCVNDISPTPAVLGTMNALALTINSGIRAFAPVLATSVFAVGIKWGFADGHLAFILLIVLAVALHVACYFIPEAAEGRPKKMKPADEED